MIYQVSEAAQLNQVGWNEKAQRLTEVNLLSNTCFWRNRVRRGLQRTIWDIFCPLYWCVCLVTCLRYPVKTISPNLDCSSLGNDKVLVANNASIGMSQVTGNSQGCSRQTGDSFWATNARLAQRWATHSCSACTWKNLTGKSPHTQHSTKAHLC